MKNYMGAFAVLALSSTALALPTLSCEVREQKGNNGGGGNLSRTYTLNAEPVKKEGKKYWLAEIRQKGQLAETLEFNTFLFIGHSGDSTIQVFVRNPAKDIAATSIESSEANVSLTDKDVSIGVRCKSLN